MRVLLAHNYYQQPGGEDRVFASEGALLERHGHEVVRYTAHNDRVDDYSRLRLAAKTVWNHDAYREFKALVAQARPDVCHFHNTFPLMSPAVLYAARERDVPVVLTLHNFRLLCPAATLLRDGAVCESCVSKSLPWPGVLHGCYRHSRAASATTALMLVTYRALGAWSRVVDRYIALTEAGRQRFVQGGLPEEKIVVKPNFVEPDPGLSATREDYVLFAGRLAPEKGVDTLLAAWRQLGAPVRLRIAGDGPLAGRVREAAERDPRIEWLRLLPPDRVVDEMRRALLLVTPSIWYEGGLPLTVIEAYATGLPVVASRIGALAELIDHGVTGLHFPPGDAMSLAAAIRSCLHNRDEVANMGRQARRKYESHYTAEMNYRQLMRIYRLSFHSPQSAPREEVPA
jgi:glycosyltransferase involved in cell wall biosynthesis